MLRYLLLLYHEMELEQKQISAVFNKLQIFIYVCVLYCIVDWIGVLFGVLLEIVGARD